MKKVNEAYGLACALYAQLTSSSVAEAFAKLWDEKHPNCISTRLALDKLKNDYKKMKRLTFVERHSTALLMSLLSIGITLLFVLYFKDIDVSGLWYCISLIVLCLCVSEWICMKIENMVDEYCSLIEQVEWIGQIDYLAVKTIDDPINEVNRLCFVIVQAEKNGLNNQNEIEFNDCHGGRSKMCLYDLRSLVRRYVHWLVQFGLVTGDLAPHFEWARREYQRRVTAGEVMTDFQI